MSKLFSHRLRRGDIVTVLPFKEILKTLDQHGQLDNMPFMPEMQRFCGSTFQVARRANYVCVDGDGMRGLEHTVFLENMYCDGSAHDGCQKSCTIFWKEAWLKSSNSTSAPNKKEMMSGSQKLKTRNEQSNRYICQSTRLAASSCLLTPLLKAKFLLKEFFSGNQRIDKFIINFCYFLHYKLSKKSTNSVCRIVRGHAESAPRVSLNLHSSDLVEVKSLEDITDTVDTDGKNHGLVFTSEMHHFCGQRYKVLGRLDKMVSEKSGKMVTLKDTVLLENVHCYGNCKFGCARRLFHYWREIWLKKI
ncbi:hypothetical protein EH223_15895 [candidate division KSB1 bacterium]|nr:hypothetical protein [candidate division KSB1 bacterium]RQW01178.1 MAG: hypothetical protein EH223_15895 [candidate division KSB1 bacterium]